MIPVDQVFTPDDIHDISLLKTKAEKTFSTGIAASLTDAAILAGGCFSSWLHGEIPNDFDFYFLDTSENNTLYRDWFLPVLADNKQYNCFKVGHSYSKFNPKIKEVWNHSTYNAQYIWTHYKTREELISDFDFVHTQISYLRTPGKSEGTLFVSKQTLDAMNSRVLISTGKQSICQYRVDKFKERDRVDKFKERGWILKDGSLGTSFTNTVMINATGAITGVTCINTGPSSLGTTTDKTSFSSSDLEEFEKLMDSKQQVYRKMVDEQILKKSPLDQVSIEKTPYWFEEFKKKISRPWDT